MHPARLEHHLAAFGGRRSLPLTRCGLGTGLRDLRYASMAIATLRLRVKRMCWIPDRTAVSAVSRTPRDMAGGVWCASSRLLVFLGLPMPSLGKSQFSPSLRASPGWQLEQLCQPWKQIRASWKYDSPLRTKSSWRWAAWPSASGPCTSRLPPLRVTVWGFRLRRAKINER